MLKKSVSKIFYTLALMLMFVHLIQSQPSRAVVKKYPGILWEITGKGAAKPSYLFGTMHVSNKMVFNLGDSFYHAIESVEKVGLELDPGLWQEHFSKKDNNGLEGMYAMLGAMNGMFQKESLYKSIFSIDGQEKKIETTLAMEPTMINSLLYRKSEYNQDQEEDTYLDMYLYQICKKLNKDIVGLELIDTSERLMKEAETAMQTEKRTTYEDNGYASASKIEDAYKIGDLDLLDSLERILMPGKKYRAIFLDHRNEIQAASIDSVLKLKKTIFAGVGCAHLPGDMGVIEILRRMGYKLRPVKMNVRNGTEKERIDKMRFPVSFTTQYAPDSVVKADVPGKWFRFEKSGNVLQFADLANGSYYMLGRVPLMALFQGQSKADVLRKVDSLLYENIPGKIISKIAIEKDGYKGFDITNRTRRGDAQHYQIFVTPFEVIMAKMSGSMDYVLTGTEAETFFKSIAIKPLELTPPLRFTPAWGAFSISLPHYPFIQYNVSGNSQIPFEYEATDTKKGIHYCIMKETVQRTGYLEEDTFELNLLHESYMSSKVFEKQLYKKFVNQNGYPALEAAYQLKDGFYSIARFVIQGPHYYAIIAEQKKPFTSIPEPLAGFAIAPFKYREPTLQKDTVFGYSFMSPVPIPPKGNASDMDMLNQMLQKENSEMKDMLKRLSMLTLQNDSTGEVVSLVGVKFPPYTFIKDSIRFKEQLEEMSKADGDASFIMRKQITENRTGWEISEKWYGDTNTSRQLHYKTFYKNGVAIVLSQYADTLTAPGTFSETVFKSFLPADTLSGVDPLQPKGALFFKEYASTDSTTHARALSNLATLQFTKDDIPAIEKSLRSLTWGQPNYLGIKKRFIASLGRIEDSTATVLLQKLYSLANDTALYQQEILSSLLSQKTTSSFKAFEILVTSNPPVEVNTKLDKDADDINDNSMSMVDITAGTGSMLRNKYSYNRRSGYGGWGNLGDTMQLTKAILPNLINLINLDDYEDRVQSLLLKMTDSGYVASENMKPLYAKFLLEGKHFYKKAVAQESADGMTKKASELKKAGDKDGDDDDYDMIRYSYGQGKETQFDDLYDHVVLLSPFYDTEPAVRDLVKQCYSLQNKELRYKLMKLMIRKKLAPYPDSLLTYFARDEKLRRRLYNYLSSVNQLEKFPKVYSQPLDLAKSRLAAIGSNKPDTIAYIGLRPFDWQRKKGDMYFFKYKMQKEDRWKWAMIGMMPGDKNDTWNLMEDSFDELTKRKVDETKTINEQIATMLKETLYSRRKSASSFYQDVDEQREFMFR